MATKKVKHFVGDIYYDQYSRMVDSPTVKRMDITSAQTDGVYLLVDQFDYTTRTYTKVRSEFTLADWNAGPPIDPRNALSVDTHVKVPNIPFDDELVYKGFSRGQYSTTIELQSVITGKIYDVFLKDFDGFVHNMVNGVVKGKFIYRKRSYKFGLMYLP